MRAVCIRPLIHIVHLSEKSRPGLSEAVTAKGKATKMEILKPGLGEKTGDATGISREVSEVLRVLDVIRGLKPHPLPTLPGPGHL